jgi:protein-S-isoprenylcysteine O-methyltransferase Ste14
MVEPDAAARPGPLALAFAWTGAFVFVLSLGTFLYLYATGWGLETSNDASGDRWRAVFANAGLFTIFALHHSLLARTGAKRLVTNVFPSWLERSAYTWVASLLFLMVCLGWRPVPGVLYALPGGWRFLWLAAQVAGLVLTMKGTAALDALDLAGVRQVLNARHAAPPRHVPLETGGVFAIVRHPLYFGWVLLVFGAPTMTGTRLVFAVVSTAYLAIAVPFEERSLTEVFGPAYGEYQRRTRWRMVPGIW